MLLTVSQNILLVAFALAAGIFLISMAGFKTWKKLITVPGKGGFGYHYKSKAQEKAFYATAEIAQKVINPVVMLWIAGVSLGVWVIIRVVISFL